MIIIKELLEATKKRGVLAFGRMNPPTIGHQKLIDAAIKEQGEKHIYVSHTQDNKKNPLSADEKIDILHKMYPDHKNIFKTSSKEEPSIFHAAAKMYRDGVKHLTVVAGDDRVQEFKDKLNFYNGKFDKNGISYKFDSITVKSAGVRDPDSNGAEGISASKMRKAALLNDKQTFHSGLHPNLTDKDKDDIMEKIKKRLSPTKNETFEIGDFVTNGLIEGEIMVIHPKYAIIVSNGEEHRVWTEELVLTDYQQKRNQLYKDSFIFKGYKTKNFNRPLAEAFKELAKENKDEYAVLSCIKAFDYILNVNDNMIQEEYGTVRIQTERLRRYAKKLNAFYLVEKVVSLVEEELLKYSIIEGIKFLTTDRIMIAKVIAMVAGTDVTNADPTTTINNAIIKLRTSQLTQQGWQIVGRLMKVADTAGITWNRRAFSNSQLQMMEI